MESTDHLCLQFLDQPQYYIIVITTITFQIHNIIVTKWKHGICTNNIITFNEELEFISTSIIELVHIDECLHKNSIVIFVTKNNLNKIR